MAYCLGQLQEPASVGTLTAILQNSAEHAMCAHHQFLQMPADVLTECALLMLVSCGLVGGRCFSCISPTATCHRVRHEAAEALGAIGTDKCECMLRQHEDDDTLEVGHVSCLCKLPGCSIDSI